MLAPSMHPTHQSAYQLQTPLRIKCEFRLRKCTLQFLTAAHWTPKRHTASKFSCNRDRLAGSPVYAFLILWAVPHITTSSPKPPEN